MNQRVEKKIGWQREGYAVDMGPHENRELIMTHDTIKDVSVYVYVCARLCMYVSYACVCVCVRICV